MICPECGARTIVLDSRQRAGETHRKLECRKGHKFRTVERPIPKIEKPPEKPKRAYNRKPKNEGA